MRVVLSATHKQAKYVQIKEQIQAQIVSGELPAGFILPAERKLAEELKVNRSTVVRAYQDLKAEGFVDSTVGKGTRVLSLGYDASMGECMYVPPLRWDQQLKSPIHSYENDRIKEMMDQAARGDLISFAGGLPGEDVMNTDLLNEAGIKLHETLKSKLYASSPIGGQLALKKALCKLMEKRNVNCLSSSIMVTSGSQQGLDYVSRMLIDHGDVILSEEPTYLGALKVFESYGARVIGVPMEADGLDTDALETYVFKYRPKAIYVQPNFQNPTGFTMGMEKRHRLLAIASHYKVPIIEDDIYSDLVFEGVGFPPLKALDPSNYVIYISSFSKTISFGLRVGWVCADAEVIRRAEKIKQISDLQTQTMGQYLMEYLLREGHYQQEVKRLVKRYKEKHDRMIAGLKKYPEFFEASSVKGGFFVWTKLPMSTEMKQLEKEAFRRGVAIVAGDVFYPRGISSEAYLRLSFSSPKLHEIDEGIERLADAVKASQRTQKGPIHWGGHQPIV